MITSYQEKKKLTGEQKTPAFRLGTVHEVAEDGRCTILFDGETTASGKLYSVINGIALSSGDRIACGEISGSWIVLGRYGYGGSGGSSEVFAGNIYFVPDGSSVPATKDGDIILYYEA